MKLAKNKKEFVDSLANTLPPDTWPTELKALWWDAKGDWNKAHGIVDRMSSSEAAWIHAYLHRKEGDTRNAEYWYARAGKSRPNQPLEEEFREILQAICDF